MHVSPFLLGANVFAALIPVMTQTLANLFKSYRPIMPIVAHRNLRMRGQAFVTFPDIETANRARREVGEFPLYGKPVVSDVSLSLCNSPSLSGVANLSVWIRISFRHCTLCDTVLNSLHGYRGRCLPDHVAFILTRSKSVSQKPGVTQLSSA